MNVTENEIRFDGGDAALRAVLCSPGSAPVGALVLLPDVRGVSPLYRGLGVRLAREGFATLVLDIYSRSAAPELPDVESALRFIAEIPDRRVLADVGSATRHLRERAETRECRVGVLGFCLGGQYAVMAACEDASLAACVSFYGMLRYDQRPAHKPKSPLDVADRLGCPLLGLYGADDPLVTPEDRLALEAILRRERKEFGLHVFGGAGHAFMNDTRPTDYRPAAAATAWRLCTEFLGSALSNRRE